VELVNGAIVDIGEASGLDSDDADSSLAVEFLRDLPVFPALWTAKTYLTQGERRLEYFVTFLAPLVENPHTSDEFCIIALFEGSTCRNVVLFKALSGSPKRQDI
jgi:hypothetical protein